MQPRRSQSTSSYDPRLDSLRAGARTDALQPRATSPLSFDSNSSAEPEGSSQRPAALRPARQSSRSSSGGEEEPRRTRIMVTEEQSAVLYSILRENPFPSTEQREQIAQRIGMTPRRVQVWFQNRRQNMRQNEAARLRGLEGLGVGMPPAPQAAAARTSPPQSRVHTGSVPAASTSHHSLDDYRRLSSAPYDQYRAPAPGPVAGPSRLAAPAPTLQGSYGPPDPSGGMFASYARSRLARLPSAPVLRREPSSFDSLGSYRERREPSSERGASPSDGASPTQRRFRFTTADRPSLIVEGDEEPSQDGSRRRLPSLRAVWAAIDPERNPPNYGPGAADRGWELPMPLSDAAMRESREGSIGGGSTRSTASSGSLPDFGELDRSIRYRPQGRSSSFGGRDGAGEQQQRPRWFDR